MKYLIDRTSFCWKREERELCSDAGRVRFALDSLLLTNLTILNVRTLYEFVCICKHPTTTKRYRYVLFNYVEMARVTGVPLDFLLTRGQQIKVVSMLYRKALSLDLVVPTLRKRGDLGASNNYEGATVIEPKRAFYDTPIATVRTRARVFVRSYD